MWDLGKPGLRGGAVRFQDKQQTRGTSEVLRLVRAGFLRKTGKAQKKIRWLRKRRKFWKRSRNRGMGARRCFRM